MKQLKFKHEIFNKKLSIFHVQNYLLYIIAIHSLCNSYWFFFSIFP